VPRSKPTLFDQLRLEQQTEASASAHVASSITRGIVVTMATVLLMMGLPGRFGFAPTGEADTDLLGNVWTQEDIVAEYSFTIPKSDEEKRLEVARAVAGTTPIFTALDVQKMAAMARKSVAEEAEKSGQSQHISVMLQAVDWLFATSPNIVNIPLRSNTSSYAEIRVGSASKVVEASTLYDSTKCVNAAIAYAVANTPASLPSMFTALHRAYRPTLVLDTAATNIAQAQAEASVGATRGIVRKGDNIVSRGSIVDTETMRRLTAYRHSQFVRQGRSFSLTTLLGTLLHALFLIGIIFLYLLYCRKKSFERIGQLTTLTILPAVVAACTLALQTIPAHIQHEYLVVIPAISMVISVLYDARVSLVVTLAMAASVGAMAGSDYASTMVLFCGGCFGAFAATNIRKRSQIFTSIVLVLVGLTVPMLAIELVRSTPLEIIGIKIGLLGINALVSPILALAAVMIVERVLHVATDLRLEEFDSVNHPLLVQLNERAPGTYQHTLAVARLSESAAVAIEANALLAKVGAYFHDIGKMEKSEYFVENQIDIHNKHNHISARKSASIIRQHVQDGIELAREYKLPQQILYFIPMHHGTILIQHFYAKALEEATDKQTVQESDFRYPGPKPNSKETAIVMLADAVEAMSRLIDTTSKDELEAAISGIIQQRISDDQLSEAPITIQELQVVKESFIKNLLGRSHPRIRYKDVSDSPTAAV
jgi:cyclic-di-AMP phosphodiesterase PgpH